MVMITKGLCLCGCGKQTPIAKRARFGNTPGEPLKYIKGHSPQEVEARKKVKARTIQKNKEYALGYLRNHPCIDCGESDPIVLDFDHRDGTEKYRGVSDIVTCGLPIYRVIAEIEKCDVRCANCHRRRHAQEYAHGWRNQNY